MNPESSGEAVANVGASASPSGPASGVLTRRSFVGGVAGAGALLSIGGWARPVAASGAGRTPRGLGSVSGAPDLPQGFKDVFTSRYVDTGDVRLHAVTGGDGPPLLLVHGWPQTWYAWRLVMPALARHHHVIAVDQRGIGLSDKPQDGYDSATLAGDMVALMDALGHHRFSVYGTDVGMPIAYAVAADHRDRVDRLAVSEAFLPGLGRRAGTCSSATRSSTPDSGTSRSTSSPPTSTKHSSRDARTCSSVPSSTPLPGPTRCPTKSSGTTSACCAPTATPCGAASGSTEHGGPPRTRTCPRFGNKLTVPVLAIGGELSSGKNVSTVMMAVATDVEEVIIPGAGHWVAEEAPDQIVAALTAFLD